MTYDEAISIRQLGEKAQPHLLAEAERVIRLRNCMTVAQRHGEVPTLDRFHIERANCLLAYRLALACGMLNDWRSA